MTSTSGPGISLMSEFTGLAYYAEMPAVIFDVQRVGPSTGLPTRTAQGDIAFAAGLSHGDTKHILLLPASVSECYTMSTEAFDLAERFQTPIFVMTDLDLGMNNWMAEPFPYPEAPLDRGKVLTPETLQAIGEWGRYKDVDGDGIPYRTLPGQFGPSFFTRGSGHNAKAQYSEKPDDYTNNIDRLLRKFETARTHVPRARDRSAAPARGSASSPTARRTGPSSRAATSCATNRASRRRTCASARIPFTHEIGEFIDAHDRIYVVEQNRDGQMAGLLRQELSGAQIAKLTSVRHYNGLPIDARSVTEEIRAHEARMAMPPETSPEDAIVGAEEAV